MTTTDNERPIPTPPGGGSWSFDRARWDWVSNDTAPAEQPADAQPASVPEQPETKIGEE